MRRIKPTLAGRRRAEARRCNAEDAEKLEAGPSGPGMNKARSSERALGMEASPPVGLYYNFFSRPK